MTVGRCLNLRFFSVQPLWNSVSLWWMKLIEKTTTETQSSTEVAQRNPKLGRLTVEKSID